MNPVPLRPASTVLLLRDGTDGLETFMVQRHHRSGFMPNAWVFPGGRVDPTDQLADHEAVHGVDALAAGVGLEAPVAAGFGVAAVRETFEESGVWLGTGEPGEPVRKALHAGDTTMAEVLATGAGPIDLGQLVPWAWWLTPKAEARRFEALFFAIAAHEADGTHDTIETVASRWVSPRWAATVPGEEFALPPPTWWTLVELSRYATVAEALAAPPWTGRTVEPVIRFPDSGIELILPGHPDHPDPEVDRYPHRLTFDRTWIGWRGDSRFAGR